MLVLVLTSARPGGGGVNGRSGSPNPPCGMCPEPIGSGDPIARAGVSSGAGGVRSSFVGLCNPGSWISVMNNLLPPI